MLSRADNEKICRVGPETPMGKALRRHWLPLMPAQRLEAATEPLPVPLVGQEFVLWKDASGQAGLFDLACLHRGASLRLARAEDDGLRCIYHGWKFAVDGRVLDTPNVADPAFAARLRGRTYPLHEAGGLLWTYLGPRELAPEFPRWPWMDLPGSQRMVIPHVQDCNFVQIIEGLVDSSHLGILHTNGLRQATGSALNFAQKVESMQRNLAPRLEAEETDFGFYYAALRDIDGGTGAARTEARITAFVAPFTVLNPNGDIMSLLVPISDTRTAFYHVFWSDTQPINAEPLRSQHLRFVGLTSEALEGFGISEAGIEAPDRPQPSNNFHQNREAMHSGASFSGLPGLIEEDVAVAVSSGLLRDRSREVLCTADVAIRKLYLALLRVADGADLPEVPAIAVRSIAGIRAVLENGGDWRALVQEMLELPRPRPVPHTNPIEETT